MSRLWILVVLANCGGDAFTAAAAAGDAGDELEPGDVAIGDVLGERSPVLDSQQSRDGGRPSVAHDASNDVLDAGDVPVDAIAADVSLCCIVSCPNPKPEPRCPGSPAACLVPCP